MKDRTKFIIASILYIIWTFAVIRYAAASPAEDFKKYAFRAQVLEVLYGVPASVQLAQSFCETNHGRADTIGTLYNNWFSIMDFNTDYWELGSGPAMNWNKTRSENWRRYSYPLISWIDHAYFLWLYNPKYRYKDFLFWCDNPVRYGRRGYWRKIKKTILKYNLQKYDIF